jgi:murein hydrolase activator
MNPKPTLSKFLPSTAAFAKACLLVLSFFALSSMQAQSKEDLQKERDRISQEISLTSKLIKEKQESRSKIEGELSLINRKINLREDLIKSLRREIVLYNQRINENKAEVRKLESDLEETKANYAEMVRYAQRSNRAEDKLMYIFASSDFFQASQRVRYLRQIADYRESQAKEIVTRQEHLNALNLELLKIINEKDALLQKEEEEKGELARDKTRQQSAVSGLKQEEKNLLKKLKEQEKQREKLNKEIQRIIEAEIRASKKDNAGVFSLTPEAAALSASFESNKGKLPWPVERGVITAKFGNNPHPILAGITVPNNGVDIATSPNSEVRAIFEGTVSGVFSIPGAGANVIINHGGYRSVYSNLKEVRVSKGDKITIKQVIGTVLTDEGSGKTEAHLEIWKVSEAGPVKQDPALWIFRQ